MRMDGLTALTLFRMSYCYLLFRSMLTKPPYLPWTDEERLQILYHPVPSFASMGLPPLDAAKLLHRAVYFGAIACLPIAGLSSGRFTRPLLFFTATSLYWPIGTMMGYTKKDATSPYVSHTSNLPPIVLLILALAPKVGKQSPVWLLWRCALRGFHAAASERSLSSGDAAGRGQSVSACGGRDGGMTTSMTWPLALIRWHLACAYLGAGYCKVQNAGWRWADGRSLRFGLVRKQLLNRTGRLHLGLSTQLSSRPDMCMLASIASLALELSFPLAAFVPHLSVLFSTAALCMHWSIWLTMGIDFFQMFALTHLVFLPDWIHAFAAAHRFLGRQASARHESMRHEELESLRPSKAMEARGSPRQAAKGRGSPWNLVPTSRSNVEAAVCTAWWPCIASSRPDRGEQPPSASDAPVGCLLASVLGRLALLAAFALPLGVTLLRIEWWPLSDYRVYANYDGKAVVEVYTVHFGLQFANSSATLREDSVRKLFRRFGYTQELLDAWETPDCSQSHVALCTPSRPRWLSLGGDGFRPEPSSPISEENWALATRNASTQMCTADAFLASPQQPVEGPFQLAASRSAPMHSMGSVQRVEPSVVFINVGRHGTLQTETNQRMHQACGCRKKSLACKKRSRVERALLELAVCGEKRASHMSSSCLRGHPLPSDPSMCHELREIGALEKVYMAVVTREAALEVPPRHDGRLLVREAVVKQWSLREIGEARVHCHV